MADLTLKREPVLRLSKLRANLQNPAWRRRTLTGYAFASPWVIGFFVIYLIPLILSAYYSFTTMSLIRDPVWVGLQNYDRLFNADPRFAGSIMNTLYYTVFSVPINLVGALLIAVVLNRTWRGISVFRTIVYLPAILSGVAMALVWKWMFNPQVGAINWLLSLVGIQGPNWLFSMDWSKPAFIVMNFWSVGPAMIIFLAALKRVPDTLYEAADIDGAGKITKFFRITMPMISPATLFNSVTMIIASFQIFTPAWVLTSSTNAIGTPGDSTLFYVLYLFWKAFVRFEMGAASAMAWMLTLVVVVLTLIQLALSSRWVYYETS